MEVRKSLRRCALMVVLLSLAGCISITRKQSGMRFSTATLREASLDELVRVMNANAAALRSFNAKIDMDYTVGGRKKGKITKYKEISGTMLLRKPSELRIIGLVPVVHNRMFDMVSDGRTFQISIPGQSKFLVGTNQINAISEHPLENLRPQHIFDALPLKGIDPESEIAVLESGMEIVKDPKTHQDAEQPDYEIVVIRKDGGSWRLSRKIVFSRIDLLPYRLVIYNPQGEIETDVHYGEYATYSGIQFPTIIEIQRPIEELGITLNMAKMSMNETLRDDQFQIVQPPGVTVINLDQKNRNTTAVSEQGPAGEPKRTH